ncbi:hypothetical protein WAI453_004983 [Rhynchosporium graminicola]
MITPIKRGPTQFIYVNQLSKGPPLVMVHSNASVYEFMSEISKENNVPVDQMRLLYNSRRLEKNHLLSHYGIPDKSTVKLILNIQGRGLLSGSNPADAEMSVGAGDLIKQSILRDPHAAIAWEGDSTAIFNIQLLNATNFCRVTGTCAPSSPITASQYAAAGLPFFSLPAEVEPGSRASSQIFRASARLILREAFRIRALLRARARVWRRNWSSLPSNSIRVVGGQSL